MNRLHALLIVLILWAGIFLPGLGSVELKGEEGRRILPAVTMLQTGHWVVPYVGGKPFLRKPPLVNWAIAGSLKLFGTENEWAARLPSVLAILALAAAIVAAGGRPGWMNVETALLASILTITQLGMIEKGRLAEIEGIYTALSGIGMLLWLAWWTEGRSAWLVWTVTCIFLGVALLAKAPLHFIFFYAIVIASLVQTGEWRRLDRSVYAAHAIGLLLMVGMFACWWIPYHHDEASRQAAQVWQKQMEDRLAGQFHFTSWLLNIPRGLSNHLPWVLFAPILWRKDLDKLGERDAAIFRGTRLALVICFFGLLLLPGVLPRYLMPLSVPFALLLAIALADPRLAVPAWTLRTWWRTNTSIAIGVLLAACLGPIAMAIGQRRHVFHIRGDAPDGYLELLTWPLLGSGAALVICLFAIVGRWKLARPALIAMTSSALMAAAMLLYSTSIVPFMRGAETLRPTAAIINQFVPEGQSLVIYDPQYQPVIFYLRVPYTYANAPVDISREADWVLARTERVEKLQKERPEFETVHEFSGGALPRLALLRRR